MMTLYANKRNLLNWDDHILPESIDHTSKEPLSNPENHGGLTGLENLSLGAARIQVDDKGFIICGANPNHFFPSN